jgi:hypothetical protein
MELAEEADLAEETRRAQQRGVLALESLEGHGAAALGIPPAKHERHPAAADLVPTWYRGNTARCSSSRSSSELSLT